MYAATSTGKAPAIGSRRNDPCGAHEPDGRIFLECASGIMGALGPEYLAGFSRRFPRIEVDCRESDDGRVDADLLSGACSIALVASPYLRGCTVRELYCCPACFWIPPGDPLSKKPLLEADDLAGRTIAMPGGGFKCRDRLMRYSSERGIELGEIVALNEPWRLYEFAAQGNGLAFTVRHLRESPVFSHLSDGIDMAAVPIDGVSWSFGIAWREGHLPTSAERVLWEWSVDYRTTLPPDRCCNRFLKGMCTREP